MIKRILSHIILCITSFTVVCGCINYTTTGIVESAPAKVVENDRDKQHIYEYVDFRNPVTKISESNSVSVPTNPATEYHDVEYPIIFYSAYEVAYNSEYKIPRWVKYELAQSETDGPYSRKGLKFCQDPSANVPQADDYDYRNSGWSKGHMAPAGDFKWSSKAMIESFYFTNCCPQNQSLNGGQWSTLEKKIRQWANKYGSVTVVTGPLVFENAYGTIGPNKVVVPDAFFKAVLAGEQSIAFVMYNKADNENMQKCAMSVDELENLSGLDFFSELDDTIEATVESNYTLRYWGL